MLFNITFALTAAGFGEGQTFNVFEIVLVGFSFVFFILLILSFLTSILGKVFARIPVEKPSSPVVAKTAATLQKSPASSTDIENDFAIEESDPHYIAVVAAAIHSVMNGRKHRIVSIRSNNSGWAAEGRRQIFSSHNLR